MPREAILLSVKPKFVARILEGTKTAELRRVRPAVVPGQIVLIYSSHPAMALVASAVVQRVEVDQPRKLWLRVREVAGVSVSEYADYFDGSRRASAIRLTDIRALHRPIRLAEMRRRWPWLRPPQSYRYVGVTLTMDATQIKKLTPSARKMIPKA
jgi:predicted transcriptional regulator